MVERSASAEDARGRMVKAEEFAEGAAVMFDEQTEESDHPAAYVTLAVQSGIAAADVICIRALGYHHTGSDHMAAAAMLAKVDSGAAQTLRRLLAVKSKAEYAAGPPSRTEVRNARRDHLRLLGLARERS